MPITLDVSEDFAANISQGDSIALRDAEGVLIATMNVSDIWQPDKQSEAQRSPWTWPEARYRTDNRVRS